MSINKENVNDINKRVKAHRKSSGAPKSVLIASDVPNSSGLTSDLAGYVDYVRKLERENEHLKADKETIISTCNDEISNIKSTYGGEIDALRKALDESTKEKCTIEYHNEKLLEENNNLKIKFARKIEAINELEKRYEEAEANLIKSRKGIDQYDSVCQENEELSRHNCLINEQLKCEIKKRTDAESRVLTLCDEVEFLKKISSSNSNFNRENTININNKTEAYYHDKFDVEMKEIREELTKEFDQYKKSMEDVFNHKLNEVTIMNTKLNEKVNKMYSEKKILQSQNDALNSDIEVMKNKIVVLNARDMRNAEMISKINMEHDDFIKDILEENTDLKCKLKDMSLEITNLLNEKIANEKETYIFRSMLKGEQSRFNLSDVNSPKKRKIDDDSEISAWSKGSMKLFCNADYNGNYLQLLNDGLDEINLNEWKIEIETESGSELLYTFPPRILMGGASLKVWSFGQDVTEDDNNLIMNVGLPPSDIMKCKLNNDMDEMEASFDLNKCTVKRKILKASTKRNQNQEKCSMM